MKTSIKELCCKAVGFDPSKHKVTTEIVAGITTFITMAYILVVNPNMLSLTGMDSGAAFTATALAAVVGTLLCAFVARLPFAQAPSMGANAFFAYTVCLTMGYTWQFALTGVLIEGVLFVIFSVTGVRTWIVNIIPESIKIGIGVGIGCFIAFLGLKNAGVIVNHPGTFIALGDITHGSPLLAIIGLMVMAALIVKKVKGALLIGILITTIIGIPMGITHLSGILSAPPSLSPVFCQFEWDKVLSIDMLVVVITLLSMDMFDTIGTLLTLSRKIGKVPRKNFDKALLCDSIATVCGSIIGTSTVGSYVESSSGIQSGGRTGLTSVVIAFMLLLSLFLAPLFLSIPAAAIGPAMFLVGIAMVEGIRLLDFTNPSEYIPGLVTMLAIPFTFSIANGIILGLISYTTINILSYGFKKVGWGLIILTLILSIKFIL